MSVYEWDASEAKVYIVRLNDAAIASYQGGLDGLQQTRPEGPGLSKLQVESEAVGEYKAYLSTRHAHVLSRAAERFGHSIEPVHTYFFAVNGFAAELNPAAAAYLESLPEVASVTESVAYALDTDAGPEWVGAPAVFEGNTTSGVETHGEGVIIGVLDTGINADHPSFADIGGDGYDHQNPLGAGVYVGVCNPLEPDYIPSFPCNDKLIGAWSFVDETPEDADGHGSHTASTAAGNIIESVIAAPTTSFTQTISGVAPHANIIAYDVCVVSCPTFSVLAAIDQAIQDGVDVINYSISGSDAPWDNLVELAFLDAFNAGIVVAASAGNSGPSAGTTAHTSPWVISTAASTHQRQFTNGLINLSGGSPPGDIVGAGLTKGYGPAPIVHAGAFGDALCENPFPANTWTNGEIVVCDRGAIARVTKGQNVLAGGAGGMVLANKNAEGESINSDTHYLPAVHIGDAAGDLLRAWLGASPAGSEAVSGAYQATIAGSVYNIDVGFADVLASFSSRGPSSYNLLSPSIAAPGVDIWAAWCDLGEVCEDNQSEYFLMSGTSMSSPHTAGAAALLKALHPEWTPDMIISALITTSFNGDTLFGDDGKTPATPFDVGAGRLDAAAAARAGFVLTESGENFLAADPAAGVGGDPRTLNVGALVDAGCLETCVFTRTLTSVLPYPVSWQVMSEKPEGVQVTVAPETFELQPGAEQEIIITIHNAQAAVNEWLFGSIELKPLSFRLYLPVLFQSGQAEGGQPPDYSGVIQPTASGHLPFVVRYLP